MGFMIGVKDPNVKVFTFKKADGTVSGTLSIRKPQKKKTKKLQYNFKEVSGMVLRAQTSGSARQAVIMAKSKIAILCKKLKTGEYDDKELKSAIMHARQIERVAKKRVKHLQEEEYAKRTCKKEQTQPEESAVDTAELEKLRQEMQELTEKFMEQVQECGDLNEFSEEMLIPGGDMEPEDVDLLKKKHRCAELREIMEADMKYLKAMFERLQKEKADAASGVFLELGGVEMPAAVFETPAPAEGNNLDVTV